jgi:hypothetical protein
VGALLTVALLSTTLGCGKDSKASHHSSADTGIGSDAAADAGDGAIQSTLPQTGREWVDQQDLIIMPWAYLLEDTVVETATIETERLIFPDGVNSELADYESLDILISAHPDLPFLRRITEVEHKDDQIIFETEGAALTDVLYKASFTTGEPEGVPADGEEIRTYQHRLKEKLETKDYGGGTISVESGVSAKPVFEATPSLHFSIKIEPGADEKTPKSFGKDYFQGTTKCESAADCFYYGGHTKRRLSAWRAVQHGHQTEWHANGAVNYVEGCHGNHCRLPFLENWGGPDPNEEVLVRKGWCWSYKNYCDQGTLGPDTYEVKADRPSQQPPDGPVSSGDVRARREKSFDNETIDYGYYESLRTCDDIIVSLAAEREDGLLHEAADCRAYRRNFYRDPSGYSRVTRKCDPDWFGGPLLAPFPSQADWAKKHCSGQLKSLEFDASLEMKAGLEDIGYKVDAGMDWKKKWELSSDLKKALKLRTRFLVGWLPVILTFQFDLRVEAEAEAVAGFDAMLLEKFVYDDTFDVGFHYYAGSQYSGAYHEPGEEWGKFYPNKEEAPGGFIIEPAESAWDAQFNATTTLIPELTVYLYDLVGPYIRPLSLYAQLDAATGSDSGYDCSVGIQAGVTGEIGITSRAKIPFCSSCGEFGPWPLYQDTCGVKDAAGEMMCVGSSSTISRSTECSTGETATYMNKSYCADKSWCAEKCLVGNSDNCDVVFRAQDINSVKLTVKDANDPVGKNDVSDFIELDSIWIESAGATGPNNPVKVFLGDIIELEGSANLGRSDPIVQCAGSETTQAEWETGGQIFEEKMVVTFEHPIEPGDTLHFFRTTGECLASGTPYVQLGNPEGDRWGPKMIPDTWSEDMPSVNVKEYGCPSGDPDRAQGDICIR